MAVLFVAWLRGLVTSSAKRRWLLHLHCLPLLLARVDHIARVRSRNHVVIILQWISFGALEQPRCKLHVFGLVRPEISWSIVPTESRGEAHHPNCAHHQGELRA